MIEILNWVGCLFLAACGIPLAAVAFKNKRIEIDTLFLLLWTLGELFVMIYVVSKGELALSINYVVNLLALSVVWRYKE